MPRRSLGILGHLAFLYASGEGAVKSSSGSEVMSTLWLIASERRRSASAFFFVSASVWLMFPASCADSLRSSWMPDSSDDLSMSAYRIWPARSIT